MAEELAFENGQISNFEGLVTLTSDHTAYRRASVTHGPLPTCQISWKSKKLVLNGRMDRRMQRQDIWDWL